MAPASDGSIQSAAIVLESMSQTLLVSVSNVRTLHELILLGRRDESFGGAVAIDFGPAGPFAAPSWNTSSVW